LRAKQPQTIGYGLLLSEVCKVILGFILIIHFHLGLIGAICSVITSYIIQIVLYLKLTGSELREPVKWSYLKEWLKGSLINIYYVVGTRIVALTLIFLFVYGELARSYYQAACTIAGVIGYSAFLAFALYPKLLSQTNIEDVHTSLKMVLLFAIPMTTGAIVLSESYLTILRSTYTDAKFVLPLVAMSFFCISLSQIFSSIVMGTEEIDAKAEIPFKQLVKTRLFQIFTLPYIQSAIAIPTVFFAVFYMAKTPLEAATFLALIILLTDSAMLLIAYTFAHKCLTFNFPWNSVSKYALASAVMAIVLLVIPHPTRLSITVALTLLGAAIYVTVLMLIDEECKLLVKSILQEIRRLIKFSRPFKMSLTNQK